MKKINIILLSFILIFCARISTAQSVQEDSAETAYKAGQYEEAINDYRQSLLENNNSSVLHYNLGNAYYKNKEYGKAIAEYERALLLKPRDADIKFNLKFTRAKLGISKEENFHHIFERLMHAHNQFYSYPEMILIITVLIYLLSIGWLLSVLFQWTRRSRLMLVIIFSFLISLYTVGCMSYVSYHADRAVVLDNSDTRFEPVENATVHYPLKEGQIIRIEKEEGDWLKVRRNDGKLGWIQKRFVEKI